MIEDVHGSHAEKILANEVASAAGYELRNFLTSDKLRLYFDVFENGKDIGYLSRGWTDPGFRLSQMVNVPRSFREGPWFEALTDFCATNGVAATWVDKEKKGFVTLESVLYDPGFNKETLLKAFAALHDCQEHLKLLTAAHAREAFLGKGTLVLE
jgi:hypothetical protein